MRRSTASTRKGRVCAKSRELRRDRADGDNCAQRGAPAMRAMAARCTAQSGARTRLPRRAGDALTPKIDEEEMQGKVDKEEAGNVHRLNAPSRAEPGHNARS